MRSSVRAGGRGPRRAAAAALLLPALLVPLAGATQAAARDNVSLPPVPSTLEDGQGCTPASVKKTDQLPWAQAALDLEGAWRLSRGAGVTVAVVDTGAAPAKVPALEGQVIAGPDVVAGGSAGDDCVGHGTFLAGVVVGRQVDGVRAAGVAPGARVLAVRATDRKGATSAQALAKAIRAGTGAGVRIIAVALGVTEASEDLKSAVREARDKGVLIVAPADPAGQGQGPSYPAALPGVLAVSAVGPDGAPPSRAGGKVAVAGALTAPGVAVTGPGPGGPGQFTGSGDAVATAFVAGTAALVLARQPDLTADQLRRRLTGTGYGPSGGAALDPVQAIAATAVDGERAANASGAAAPPALARRASADGPRQALVVAGSAAAVTALVAGAAVVLPRARRRGWRPGRAG
ncbi:S8 family serine peptidase [Streptomyces sp. NBC_00648]|uniref:S8 family serine peptidase n=1 Tax=Streptomyces sp. NBC_00648 TaxID=2975797 RepID=UPI003255F1D2